MFMKSPSHTIVKDYKAKLKKYKSKIHQILFWKENKPLISIFFDVNQIKQKLKCMLVHNLSVTLFLNYGLGNFKFPQCFNKL